jgi:ParB family chromosome partitioning protein
MQSRKALGKGLASLIPSEPVVQTTSEGGASLLTANVDCIVPNRAQPRRKFSEEALAELATSIKENGIIQPLVVTPAVAGRYELIVGERRLRASKMAGLTEVPIIIKEADPETMLELALIENIQREDLNPIEEAIAYKDLMEAFNYTQEEVAGKVSKSRPHVANYVRLLHLPRVIQEDVEVGRLSPGHARALLAVADLQEQLRIRESILHSKLTVRDVERLIQETIKGGAGKGKSKKKKLELSPQMKAVLNEMIHALGTKVKIVPGRNNKGGHLIIDYYSVQDLNRIYKKMVSN